MRWFKKKEKISKEELNTRLTVAQELRRDGEYKQAEKQLMKLLKEAGQEPLIYRAFGWLFVKSGDLKRAEENFRKSNSLEDIPLEMDLNTGPIMTDLLYRNGKTEEARRLGYAILNLRLNAKVLYLLTEIALKEWQPDHDLNSFWFAYLEDNDDKDYLKNKFWAYCRTFGFTELYSYGLGVKGELEKKADHANMEILYHPRSLLRVVWYEGVKAMEKPSKKGSESLLRSSLFYYYASAPIRPYIPPILGIIQTKSFQVAYFQFVEERSEKKGIAFHKEAMDILIEINEMYITPEYEKRLGSMAHHSYVQMKRGQLKKSTETLIQHSFIRYDDSLNQKMVRIYENLDTLLQDFDGVDEVFSHGDYHIGNLMNSYDGIQVIDWDVSGIIPFGFDIGTYLGQLRSLDDIESLGRHYYEKSGFRESMTFDSFMYVVSLMMAVRYFTAATENQKETYLNDSIRQNIDQITNIATLLDWYMPKASLVSR
ncbi:phosphotransferase [Salisediminibacterium selenitireducens]|uniref:Aminoglycoside phosphotransferase domain-containing protein n=1 Tax=Bacillus selenitireducens (strain ATCC 700615 / DSM 15326 / MLS10) TaxID=439292 RepID=D6XZP4_BACIE|nr:phosphotransferase [Salisediminibacterium selenitireducens]ADH98418.1 hypothetical protein Bsel_0895 [[Bacillus] selenitireducens MLS10]